MTKPTPILAISFIVAFALSAHADLSYKVPDRFKSSSDPNGMPFITLTTAGPFGTPDGANLVVGNVKDLTLKLAREYDRNNNQFTHIFLSYYFANYPGTESDRGMNPDQRLNVNLLDGNGNYVVRDLILAGSPVPRNQCHRQYIFVSPDQALPFEYGWKSNFDFVGKDIQSIEVKIASFGGYQGPC
jgi:hypothetical protein